MADVLITQKIPSDKVAKLTPWFLAEKPIPQIPDPDWVQEDHPGEMQPYIDQYGLKEWVNICQIKNIRLTCIRGRTKLALAAQEPFDNDIVVPG